MCNYCHQIDALAEGYGTGTAKGEKKLEATFEDIRRAGRGKKYDCVIGVSGGTDSSFMLCMAKQHGLHPLAVLAKAELIPMSFCLTYCFPAKV